MPFDLPPPLPPQLTDSAVVEERYETAEPSNHLVLEVGGRRLLISGNTYLTKKRIREITEPANTASQAIRLLNALYRAKGYLFVTVTYAPDKDSKAIYIHVHEGTLAEVKAPDFIEPFFETFEGEHGVTESDVKPNRILAGIKSERAGYNLFTRFSLVDDKAGAYKLIVEGRQDPDHQPVEFTATFGNPGNRFLGRYFGVASMTIHTPSGDNIAFSYGTAFTDLGESQPGNAYDRYSFGYSTVTTFGLYSLSGSYTTYEASDILEAGAQDQAQAEITQININGAQFLYADADTRILLEESLQYIDSTIEITEGSLTLQTTNGNPGGLLGGLLGNLLDAILGGGGGGAQTRTVDLAGTILQDETYGAARLGASFSQSWTLFGHRGRLLVNGGYKQGFAGEIDNNVVDPMRTADFGLIDADLSVSYALPADLLASIEVKSQFSTNDRLPQQQQWVLGGPGNLSAFLPGVLVGDTGAYGRFQIDLPRWHVLTRPFRISLFVEAGSASFEGSNPPSGLTERRTATDAGIKLQFSPVEHIEVTGYVAEPLSTSHIPESRLEEVEADVYFTINATF